MDPRDLSGFRGRWPGARAVLLGAALFQAAAQTTIDLRTQAKSVDFSAASMTRPLKTGTALPSTCSVGELFFKTDASAGGNVHGCVSANTWVAQAGGGSTGGSATPNASQSFTSATAVTFAHGLGTVNVLVQCYDGASRAIEYQTLTVTDNNNVSIQFAAPQTGRCVANGVGGTAPGGGGGGGETNTASNVGTGGTGLFHQKFGVDLQFKNLNSASGRVSVSNDAANREVDIDVVEAGIDLASLGGSLNPSQITSSGRQGNGTKVQMFGGGTANANDCAKFDAAGNVVSAGAACGTGSGSGSGEVNTASNAGTGGVGMFFQKSGVDLQFKNLNAASNRISLFNDTANREVDIDVVTGNLDLATMGGTIGASQVASAAKQGTGSKLQTFGGGTPAANDCAKFDSTGAVVSAGGPCGGGGGGGDTINSDFGIVIAEVSPGVKRVSVDTAAVPTFLTATASLDFTTISQDTCAEQTLSLPGAATGDALAPGWPHTLEAGLTGVMFISAQNTVTVRLCKFTAGAVDPANQPFRATLVRSF